MVVESEVVTSFVKWNSSHSFEIFILLMGTGKPLTIFKERVLMQEETVGIFEFLQVKLLDKAWKAADNSKFPMSAIFPMCIVSV